MLSRLRGTVVAAGSAIVGRSLGGPRRPSAGVNLPANGRPVSAAIQLVLYVRV